MNFTWWLGFVLLAIVPLPMDFISLGLASASLSWPFGTAVTVITGQVIGPMLFKGEALGRIEWAGSICVIIGCSLTTAFGDHVSRVFTGDEILLLYGQPGFLMLLVPQTILFVIAIVCSLPSVRKSVPPWIFFASIVYIPSYIGGVQTISFKSMSELTSNAATSGSCEFTSPALSPCRRLVLCLLESRSWLTIPCSTSLESWRVGNVETLAFSWHCHTPRYYSAQDCQHWYRVFSIYKVFSGVQLMSNGHGSVSRASHRDNTIPFHSL